MVEVELEVVGVMYNMEDLRAGCSCGRMAG